MLYACCMNRFLSLVHCPYYLIRQISTKTAAHILESCCGTLRGRQQCAAFVPPALSSESSTIHLIQGSPLSTSSSGTSATRNILPTPCFRQSQPVHLRPMAHVLRKGLVGARRGLAAGAARSLSAHRRTPRAMAMPAEPAKLAAVVYTYVDGMLEKRAPHRSEHLALLKTMTEEGACLLGGAYVEPCDGAFLLFSSPDQAKQFVEKDPYNTAGLVTNYQIRNYMAVTGTMHK